MLRFRIFLTVGCEGMHPLPLPLDVLQAQFGTAGGEPHPLILRGPVPLSAGTPRASFARHPGGPVAMDFGPVAA